MKIAGVRIPGLVLAILAALVGYIAAMRGFKLLPGAPAPAAAS